jgi:hypothetical protein
LWFKASPGILSQKTLHKNRADKVTQGEGPEFKPQYHKKKKRKKDMPIKGISQATYFLQPVPTS